MVPDKELSWLLPMEIRSVSGRTIKALLVLGSTRVFSRLFSSLGPAAIFVGSVMALLALSVLVVEAVSPLTRWIHNPDTRDDITLVLARKRPAPE